MVTRWRRWGAALAAVGVAAALGCARLEPVEDASELAVRPEPAAPPEQPKEEELIPIKFLPEDKPVSYVMDEVLKAKPVGADKEALRLALSKIGSARVLLCQINADLKPRYYQGHDETVCVIKGHGIMIIGEDRYVAKAGSVFVIPRNIVHSFINTGEKPFVALVVQSPPPLGGDMVLVRPKKEQ